MWISLWWYESSIYLLRTIFRKTNIFYPLIRTRMKMLFFLKILRTYQMNDPYLLNMWVANSWLITKCKLVSVINAFSEIFFLLSFFVYLWRLIFPLGIVTRSQAKNGALFERFAFFLFLFNEFYFLFTKFFFF